MKRLLSTRQLTTSQRELVLGAGLSLVCYDAISIIPLEFEIPDRADQLIFTSQNAVRAVLSKLGSLEGLGAIYCVGKKTKALCEKNGGNVIFCAKNSEKLANYLINEPKADNIIYFCGAQRLDVLPDALKVAEKAFFEVKTYKTTQNLREMGHNWDGILFFSPSGVQSYFTANPHAKESALFCIGPTTAAAAARFGEKVVISNSPTSESLIAKAVKTLNE